MIRPILPTDVYALGAFFAALSPTTLRLRFHFPLREVAEEKLREFTMVDHRCHVALVAEAHCEADQSGGLIAEGRYICEPAADCAEFALVVADGWRRVGLGTSLACALLQRARFAGVRRLCGDALAENDALFGFVRSLGARSTVTRNAEIVRLCLET